MYEGKQVVRVVTQYKKDDLYNIGVEMNKRKGTGNYAIALKMHKEKTSFCNLLHAKGIEIIDFFLNVRLT